MKAIEVKSTANLNQAPPAALCDGNLGVYLDYIGKGHRHIVLVLSKHTTFLLFLLVLLVLSAALFAGSDILADLWRSALRKIAML